MKLFVYKFHNEMYQENFNHSLRHQLMLVRFEKPKDYAVTLVKAKCPH